MEESTAENFERDRLEDAVAEPKDEATVDPALLPFSQRIALFASAADASSPASGRGSQWNTPARAVTSTPGSTAAAGDARRASTTSASYATPRSSLRIFDAATAAAARDAAFRFFTLRSDWQGRPTAATPTSNPAGGPACAEAATQTDLDTPHESSKEDKIPKCLPEPAAASTATPGCASPDCTAQLVIRPSGVRGADDCGATTATVRAAAAAAALEQASVQQQLLSAAAALQASAADAVAADRPWLAVMRLLGDYVAEQQQRQQAYKEEAPGRAVGVFSEDSVGSAAAQAAPSAPDARLLAALLTAQAGAEREAAAGSEPAVLVGGTAGATNPSSPTGDVTAAHSEVSGAGSEAGSEVDTGGVAVAALQQQVAALREQMRQRALAQYDNNRMAAVALDRSLARLNLMAGAFAPGGAGAAVSGPLHSPTCSPPRTGARRGLAHAMSGSPAATCASVSGSCSKPAAAAPVPSAEAEAEAEAGAPALDRSGSWFLPARWLWRSPRPAGSPALDSQGQGRRHLGRGPLEALEAQREEQERRLAALCRERDGLAQQCAALQRQCSGLIAYVAMLGGSSGGGGGGGGGGSAAGTVPTLDSSAIDSSLTLQPVIATPRAEVRGQQQFPLEHAVGQADTDVRAAAGLVSDARLWVRVAASPPRAPTSSPPAPAGLVPLLLQAGAAGQEPPSVRLRLEVVAQQQDTPEGQPRGEQQQCPAGYVRVHLAVAAPARLSFGSAVMQQVEEQQEQQQEAEMEEVEEERMAGCRTPPLVPGSPLAAPHLVIGASPHKRAAAAQAAAAAASGGLGYGPEADAWAGGAAAPVLQASGHELGMWPGQGQDLEPSPAPALQQSMSLPSQLLLQRQKEREQRRRALGARTSTGVAGEGADTAGAGVAAASGGLAGSSSLVQAVQQLVRSLEEEAAAASCNTPGAAAPAALLPWTESGVASPFATPAAPRTAGVDYGSGGRSGSGTASGGADPATSSSSPQGPRPAPVPAALSAALDSLRRALRQLLGDYCDGGSGASAGAGTGAPMPPALCYEEGPPPPTPCGLATGTGMNHVAAAGGLAAAAAVEEEDQQQLLPPAQRSWSAPAPGGKLRAGANGGGGDDGDAEGEGCMGETLSAACTAAAASDAAAVAVAAAVLSRAQAAAAATAGYHRVYTIAAAAHGAGGGDIAGAAAATEANAALPRGLSSPPCSPRSPGPLDQVDSASHTGSGDGDGDGGNEPGGPAHWRAQRTSGAGMDTAAAAVAAAVGGRGSTGDHGTVIMYGDGDGEWPLDTADTGYCVDSSGCAFSDHDHDDDHELGEADWDALAAAAQASGGSEPLLAAVGFLREQLQLAHLEIVALTTQLGSLSHQRAAAEVRTRTHDAALTQLALAEGEALMELAGLRQQLGAERAARARLSAQCEELQNMLLSGIPDRSPSSHFTSPTKPQQQSGRPAPASAGALQHPHPHQHQQPQSLPVDMGPRLSLARLAPAGPLPQPQASQLGTQQQPQQQQQQQRQHKNHVSRYSSVPPRRVAVVGGTGGAVFRFKPPMALFGRSPTKPVVQDS